MKSSVKKIVTALGVGSILCGSLFALTSYAKVGSSNNNNDIAQLITKSSHGNLKLVKIYEFNDNKNIVPIIVESTQTKSKGILWVIDNKYIATGMLIGPDGKNMNIQFAKKAKLGVAKLPHQAIYNYMLKAPGFTMGDGPVKLYEFVDPNCIFCHKIYEAQMPYIKNHQITVKYVPVGFLKGQNSIDKSAIALSSKNPAEAWAENEKNFNVVDEMGGISLKNIAKNPPSKLAYNEVQENTLKLAQTGELATPTIVFKTKDGKIKLYHGLPGGGYASFYAKVKGEQN